MLKWFFKFIFEIEYFLMVLHASLSPRTLPLSLRVKRTLHVAAYVLFSKPMPALYRSNPPETCPRDEVEFSPEHMDAQWERLLAAIREREVKYRKVAIRSRVGVAAVLGLVLISGYALGVGLLPWTVSIVWDDQRLNITLMENTAPLPRHTMEPPEGLGVDMIDLLRSHGFAPPLPAALPGGFAPAGSYYIFITDDWDQIIASYVNEERHFDLIINRYTTEGGMYGSYEKDDASLTEHHIGGMIFITFENLGYLCAEWREAPYSVSISGDLTYEEMTAMFRSVPSGGSFSTARLAWYATLLLVAAAVIAIVVYTYKTPNKKKG